MIKILHAADFHMDSPFYSLPPEKSARRRREQRELLDRLASAAEDVDLVLLAGDLFDSEASYWETTETLKRVFSAIKAHIFIAPGNHDYYTARSPYAFMDLPSNVHLFKTSQLRSVELPELNARVWGAGFTAAGSEALLKSFTVRASDLTEIMVLHGDIAANSRYNAISEADIARTGLDYLALGHVHTFSGIKKAGDTFYAYPGCLEGRGFDETGPKGFIKGTVDKRAADLSFVPIAQREYRVIEADLTGETDIVEAAKRAVGDGYPRDIVRLILKGETDAEPDLQAVSEALSDRFFHLTVKSELRRRRPLWEGAGEDTLTGMFLADLKSKYDESRDAESRELLELAARFGISALEGREEWSP